MESLIASSVDFEHMFELAPVSLWLEDYSALKRLLDQWRAQGVTDLQAHFSAHPPAPLPRAFMNIGPYVLANRVLVAPMAGVTDRPWVSFAIYLVVFDFADYWIHRTFG